MSIQSASNARRAATMRKQWRDPVYREKIVSKSAPRFAVQGKKNWANKDYRRKLLRHLKTFSKTPEQRAANSARMKAWWANPENRARMCRDRKSSYTPERSAQVIAARKKNNPDLEVWNKGLTKATHRSLARISKKLRGQVPDFKKYRAWYRGSNGAIHMRSKWEVAYAQYLDRLGVDWKYEPKWFYIGPGKYKGETHLPDFYLVKQKKYVEIKGRYLDQDKAKIEAFRSKYPKLKWEMLRAPELKALGVIDIHGCAILDKK